MITSIPHIVGIFIAADAGLSMQQVVLVNAVAGKGLLGDRYAEERGIFSKKYIKIRHATLIAMEAIEIANSKAEVSFTPADTRRNIITRGVDLNSLVGKRFWLGGVEVRGTELCDPCERPSKLSGKKHFKEIFDNAGGLRVEILNDGEIKAGDPITISVPQD